LPSALLHINRDAGFYLKTITTDPRRLMTQFSTLITPSCVDPYIGHFRCSVRFQASPQTIVFWALFIPKKASNQDQHIETDIGQRDSKSRTRCARCFRTIQSHPTFFFADYIPGHPHPALNTEKHEFQPSFFPPHTTLSAYLLPPRFSGPHSHG
jgi:hypothetical protein